MSLGPECIYMFSALQSSFPMTATWTCYALPASHGSRSRAHPSPTVSPTPQKLHLTKGRASWSHAGVRRASVTSDLTPALSCDPSSIVQVGKVQALNLPNSVHHGYGQHLHALANMEVALPPKENIHSGQTKPTSAHFTSTLF
jgi:hypothetical protein